MIKSTILSDLVAHLETHTQMPTVLFDFYVLNKETIPAILIKDEMELIVFEILKHSLNISHCII